MNETKAIAIVQPQELAPVAPTRAVITRAALAEATEQRVMLKQYIADNMVEGVDFGKIPGAGDKPALFKAGAEKLLDLFHCTPLYKQVRIVEDFDKGFFHYQFRCRITPRGAHHIILAEGFGSANSRESKYRYRDGSQKCPRCNKDTIIKGKEEFGGGWLCYKKKGGCGAKYGEKDQAIVGQQVGRVENDDICSAANTILKMAKKRSLCDAAIAMARCSDMFTSQQPGEKRLPPDRPNQADEAAVPPDERAEDPASAKLNAEILDLLRMAEPATEGEDKKTVQARRGKVIKEYFQVEGWHLLTMLPLERRQLGAIKLRQAIEANDAATEY